MFGAQYFGQEDFAGVVGQVTATVATGGGGWTHRGTVTLPKPRASHLPKLPGLPVLPKLPKPPYQW